MADHIPLILDELGDTRHVRENERLTGVGGMFRDIYDPLPPLPDPTKSFYDRAQHHGTQDAQTTIVGFGAVAFLDVGREQGLACPAEHEHNCCVGDMLREVGDMLREMYDLNDIYHDIFDRANHTGTQPLATISDHGPVAYLDVGQEVGKVAPGDHSHEEDYMRLDVYNPQGIEGEAFARENHTGTQPHTTVTGLGEVALLDVGLEAGKVASGDHDHGTDYLRQSIHNPQDIVGDVFDRANHTGTQTWDSIYDPIFKGPSSSSPGERGIVPEPEAEQHEMFIRADASWADIFEDMPGAMWKSVYDVNEDNTVDDTEKLGTEEPAFYLSRDNHTGTQPHTSIDGLDDVIEQIAGKGQAEEYPELDANGTIPVLQLPESIRTSVRFVGMWDATTGTPAIPAATAESKGEFYRVSNADTDPNNNVTFAGTNDWGVGDWIVSEGTQWVKVDHSSKVTSVLTKQRDVTIDLIDFPDVDDVVPDPSYSLNALTFNGATWTPGPASAGDMYKSVYDIDDSGVVDDSKMLDGNEGYYYLARDSHTGTQPYTTIDGLDIYEELARKSAANGYPELDTNGKIPISQLPDSVASGVAFISEWDADTNTPAIPAASSSNKGWYYRVSVAGSTSVSGITTWQVGDWVLSEGTAWTRVKHTGDVLTVAGKNDASITLALNDIENVNATPTNNDALSFNGLIWEAGGVAAGDMEKATYDINLSNVVDDTEAFGGQVGSYYLALGNKTGTIPYTKAGVWGDGATANFGVGTNDIARGDHTHPAGDMFTTNNLSELPDKQVSRANLGLTEDIVTGSFGTTTGTVSAGDHSHLLGDLTDVDTSTVATDEILGYVVDTWKGASISWGASDLESMSDVDFTTVPADLQVLTYVELDEKWIAADPQNTPQPIGGLDDVTTTGPENGDMLSYDAGSSVWVNLQPVSIESSSNLLYMNKLTDIAREMRERYEGDQIIDWLTDLNNVTLSATLTHNVEEGSVSVDAIHPMVFDEEPDAVIRGLHLQSSFVPPDNAGMGQKIYFNSDMVISAIQFKAYIPVGGNIDTDVWGSQAIPVVPTGQIGVYIGDEAWTGDYSQHWFDITYYGHNYVKEWVPISGFNSDPNGWVTVNLSSPVTINYTSGERYVVLGIMRKPISFWQTGQSGDLFFPLVSGNKFTNGQAYMGGGAGQLPDTNRDYQAWTTTPNEQMDITGYDMPFKFLGPVDPATITSNMNAAAEVPVMAYFSGVFESDFGLGGMLGDFNLEFTRDGGASWESVTLQHEMSYNSATHVLVATHFFTGATGTSVGWRLGSGDVSYKLHDYIFGWGSNDTRSYHDVEETRTQPVGLFTFDEKLKEHGSTSGSIVLDWNDGTAHSITPTGTVTFSVANIPAATTATITLFINAGAGYTINWPGVVTWISGEGNPPELRATADIVTLVSTDGGTTLLGTYAI